MSIDELVRSAGPFLLPLLGAASLIEYVLPPFPGDTVVAVGAFLAARGEVAAWQVFAVTTLGSVVGAFLDYRFGVWLQDRIDHPSTAWARRHFPPDRIAKIEVTYRRWGPWLILANRFVPVSRALFFVFAGMSGVPLRLTLVLGAISSMAWNGLLIGLGGAVGGNLDQLLERVEHSSRWAAAGVAVVVIVVLAVTWWRRRRAEAGKDRS